MNPSPVIHSDPDILGGTPVFVGTRVPLQALIDYIEGGHSLEEFLDDFLTVSRELAIAAVEQAKALLIAGAAICDTREVEGHWRHRGSSFASIKLMP